MFIVIWLPLIVVGILLATLGYNTAKANRLKSDAAKVSETQKIQATRTTQEPNKDVEQTSSETSPTPIDQGAKVQNPTTKNTATTPTTMTNTTTTQTNPTVTAPTQPPTVAPTMISFWQVNGTQGVDCYAPNITGYGCPMGKDTLIVTYKIYSEGGTATINNCSAFATMVTGDPSTPQSYKQYAPVSTRIITPSQCALYFNAQYFGTYQTNATISINELAKNGQTIANNTFHASFK